ncbi:hypothetical protein EV182_001207 [Spiromyces aspiralis]|uniref:Uncharacterized protein n=1 Tax=Spiromyces aspiralis TaxID=68401 RepID=A0ACC1HII8_9FUNG|nr:hypothetical protein EV182_001207 [Spiromyces aspiralis]
MVDHGAASPTLALERISTLSGRDPGSRDARLMQMQWHDYLAVVCSIPDKLASLYEATSLPALLVPDRFYKKMMLDTLRGLDKFASDMPSPMEGTKLLGQLVSKICRVGYHASVAQVFDAYCAKSLASCLENTSELDVLSKCNMAKDLLYLGSLLDELPSWELARLWSSFLDHWSRPVLGLTSKDDVFSPQLRPWTRRVAAAVQALWGRVVVAAAATTRRGDAQSSDVDHGRLSMLVSQFTVAAYPVPLLRALVLGIQLAFGADDNSSNDDALLGIARSLIRQWGRPNFVRSGRIEVVKSLTALIVLCVGCLPATLVLDLSGDIGFAGAVPRYFSSPTSTTRVLGIIVAETVTRKAFAVRSGDSCGAQRADPEFADSGAMNLSDVDAMDINVPAEDPSAALDFGLDDILAQAGQETASGTLGRRLRQEAEEIELMRALCRPIPEQLDAMVVGMSTSAGSCGPGQQPVVDSVSAATAAAVTMFSDQPDPDTVYDRRPQSLADPEPLRSDFVKPRRPTFVRQVLQYFDAKDDALKVEAGLEACVRVVESADIKELGEVGLQLATRLVHLSNPGPDVRTLAWDTQRLKSLSALTCRIPGLAGPFLSRICFDRELSVVQRELILAALATVAMNMSGLAVEGDPPRDDGGSDLIRDLADRIEAVRIGDGGISAGKVVRRSRKLDILHSRAAGPDLAQEKRQRWNHLSGPCFFFPLVAQFEYRTVVPDGRIDVRTEMLLLSKYFNTLAIIVYTSGASVHRLKMDQELWDAVLSMRQFPELSDHTEILETVLFCLEVLISADRPLNTETLVREFGPQLTGTLDWVHELVQRRVLGPDTNSRAGRLVARISEVFDEHKAKAISRLTNTGDVVYLGSENTFRDFPPRVQTTLTNTLRDWDVEAKVYPMYETKGSLQDAVMSFSHWLVNEVAHVFEVHASKGGADVVVVLLGHSMGGLLAADSALLLMDNFRYVSDINCSQASPQATGYEYLDSSATLVTGPSPEQQRQQHYDLPSRQPGFLPNGITPLCKSTMTPRPWCIAELAGVIAYDTPYYGINSELISDTAHKHINNVKSWVVPLAAGAFALWADSKEHEEEKMAKMLQQQQSPQSPQYGSTYLHSPHASPPNLAINSANSVGGSEGINSHGPSSLPSPQTKPTDHESKASKWGAAKWGAIATAALGAAGLTAAYVRRKEISSGIDHVVDHLVFARSAFSAQELEQRMDCLLLCQNRLLVRCFYNELVDSPPTHKRCFIALPPPKSSHMFIPIPSNSRDEIVAHKSMFNSQANHYIYEMGSRTIDLITKITQQHLGRTSPKQFAASSGHAVMPIGSLPQNPTPNGTATVAAGSTSAPNHPDFFAPL